MHKKHAIIVGAGVAGLTAAWYLAKFTDIKPIVLEKEKFVGGLARTMNFDGNLLDIGGHRFFSDSEEIFKLWKEILAEDFLERRGDSKIFFRQKIFSNPIELNFRTLKNFGLTEIFSIGTSFIKAKFSQRDEKTLEDFLINRFGEKFYEIFFRAGTTKILGHPPEELDASFAKKFLEPPPEKFFYPKLGAGQLCENFSDAIKNFGGEVLTSTKVKSFRVAGNVIKSARISSPAGELTFPADYFLSSMPLIDLAEALDDGLNYRQLQIARGLEYRDFMIAGLLVEKISAAADTIYIQDSSVKISRLQIFSRTENSAWLGLEYFCSEGDDLWQMSDDDFIKFATSELVKLGLIDAADVKFGVCVKVPKAFPDFVESENFSELRGALDEIKNFYSIGRGGQHRCNKTPHSIMTAIAAICAIAGKIPKSEIWI